MQKYDCVALFPQKGFQLKLNEKIWLCCTFSAKWFSTSGGNNKITPQPSPHHIRFTALFPGPPGWAGARRELLDFMLQGKINRSRHTDHTAGRHSITSAYLHHPPIFYRPDALPATQPTVSKHWRQKNNKITVKHKQLSTLTTQLAITRQQIVSNLSTSPCRVLALSVQSCPDSTSSLIASLPALSSHQLTVTQQRHSVPMTLRTYVT